MITTTILISRQKPWYSIRVSDSLENMKIIHLVATQSAALMVYRTSNHLYSYQILFSNGLIYTPQELYPHAYIALNVGRDRIKLGTGYPD